MQRQGNKRERYQAPAEPTACAVSRREDKEEKEDKTPTLNPEISYHSGCITHPESADTKM